MKSSPIKHSKVRIGIAGVGNMGTFHANHILAGKIDRLELTAVADTNPRQLAAFPSVQGFGTASEMIRSGLIDAILVATPHYAHTTIGIEALQAGLHVLLEKPISVHRADCDRLTAEWQGREDRQVFAAMFNLRLVPGHQKIRDLVRNGELGEIRRINWIVTDWFRTHAYYASGGWRATWAGEGGGVLLNQCPHNLDLIQWIFGMPETIRAWCQFGRYHDIEVEDDVTAFLRFPGGATGVFVTSTGEAPGTNRLEITGERGRLIYEEGRLSFIRNEIPMSEFSRQTSQGFSRPGTWEVEIPIPPYTSNSHGAVLANFVEAILDGAPLCAPAIEGVHSVELANAMLLSAWTDVDVQLPIDAARYERLLRKKIANAEANPTSRKKHPPASPSSNDLSGSFAQGA